MDKIIVYFPYALKGANSGSSVRPIKILEAFRDYGNRNQIEIIEIYGDSKKRKSLIRKFKNKIDPKSVLLCYMENSTLPFWLTDKDHLPRTPFLEIGLFRYLKKHNIPLGLFYRDIYWKFRDEYPIRGLKRIILRQIYRKEHSLYEKYADRFFLPSIEMNEYAQFPNEKTITLPPGGELLLKYRKKIKTKELNLIYVGGVSERYGLREMLEAVSLSYKKNKNVKLHLVCREKEYIKYKYIFDKYNKENWLKIYHAFGTNLIHIYKLADVAIIPIQNNIYNNFAVPVKLFEYISYGLPIIGTNCVAQANIINKYKLGIVVKDSIEGLYKGIDFFRDENNRAKYSEFVETALTQKNLWVHRVEKIISELK